MAGARGNRSGTWAATSLIVLKNVSQQDCCVRVRWRYRCANRATGSRTLTDRQRPLHIYMEEMRRLRNIKVHFHFWNKKTTTILIIIERRGMRACLRPWATERYEHRIAKIFTVLPRLLQIQRTCIETFTMKASASFEENQKRKRKCVVII